MGILELNTLVGGRFKIITYRPDRRGNPIPGTERVRADWFENLVTDGGLNRMGANANYLSWCQVGSGSTSPAVTDTALVNRINGTVNTISSSSNAQASPPYYVYRTRRFRFLEGDATGNLSEVGIGWATSGSLFSRALIVDSGGSPTTITVLSTEGLDVIYEFRAYPPTSDTGGTVNIAGLDYDWVGRAADVDNFTSWQMLQDGTQAGTIFTGLARAYSGTIGAITALPSGSASNSSSAVAAGYSNNSLLREATLTWNSGAGNFIGGIGAMETLMGWGRWQFGFTPNIPKIIGLTLTLTMRHSWARKTL